MKFVGEKALYKKEVVVWVKRKRKRKGEDDMAIKQRKR